MNPGRFETFLVVASGLLWLLMVGLAGAGHWLAGLYVLLLLLLVYGVLGTAHKGRFDLRLVACAACLLLVASPVLAGNPRSSLRMVEGYVGSVIEAPGDPDRDGLYLLSDGRVVIVVGGLDAWLSQQGIEGTSDDAPVLEIICYKAI